MRKSLVFLLCMNLLFGRCLGKEVPTKQMILDNIDEERTFFYKDYESYKISEEIITNSSQDWIISLYDLDKNGKIDLGALFKIKEKIIEEDGSQKYIKNDAASAVLVNPNEDDIIDFGYLDLEGEDGILETKADAGDNPKNQSPKLNLFNI